MAVTPEIAGAVATAMGIRVEDATETIRRIREGGFWAKETRSANSIRPSLRDCACLLGALLVDAPAKYAATSVSNLMNSIEDGMISPIEEKLFTKENINTLERLNVLKKFENFNNKGHNFIDGLEISLDIVANCYREFSTRMFNFKIEVYNLDYTGAIYFSVGPHTDFKLSDFIRGYLNKSASRHGDLTRVAQCTSATLLQIIEVFRREKLL